MDPILQLHLDCNHPSCTPYAGKLGPLTQLRQGVLYEILIDDEVRWYLAKYPRFKCSMHECQRGPWHLVGILSAALKGAEQQPPWLRYSTYASIVGVYELETPYARRT